MRSDASRKFGVNPGFGLAAGLCNAICAPEMTIRPYQPSDFSRLYEINQASVPGVGTETEQSLAKWFELSTCLVAEREGAPVGFITLMELGQPAYNSPNMRWFEAYSERTGKSVIYVDRIALAPETRGMGIGERLYLAAFKTFASFDEIGCEVNTLPPNPGSHRFHQRLGFKAVGDAIYVPGEKAVRFYARALD